MTDQFDRGFGFARVGGCKIARKWAWSKAYAACVSRAMSALARMPWCPGVYKGEPKFPQHAPNKWNAPQYVEPEAVCVAAMVLEGRGIDVSRQGGQCRQVVVTADGVTFRMADGTVHRVNPHVEPWLGCPETRETLPGGRFAGWFHGCGFWIERGETKEQAAARWRAYRFPPGTQIEVHP